MALGCDVFDKARGQNFHKDVIPRQWPRHHQRGVRKGKHRCPRDRLLVCRNDSIDTSPREVLRTPPDVPLLGKRESLLLRAYVLSFPSPPRLHSYPASEHKSTCLAEGESSRTDSLCKNQTARGTASGIRVSAEYLRAGCGLRFWRRGTSRSRQLAARAPTSRRLAARQRAIQAPQWLLLG